MCYFMHEKDWPTFMAEQFKNKTCIYTSYQYSEIMIYDYPRTGEKGIISFLFYYCIGPPQEL